MNNTVDTCPSSGSVNQTEKTVLAVFFIVAMVISLLGNVLVIVTVATNRRMRTVTNYLIINMAVSDLLLTIFNTPPTIASLVSPRPYWHEGDLGVFLCKFLPFVQSVSVASSVLNMTSIAIDRFFAIVIPLRRYITFRVAYGMMVVVWLIAIAVNSPFFYAMNVVQETFPGQNSTVPQCRETWKSSDTSAPQDYTIVLFVLFYAVPLLVMSVLYSVVIYKLWIRKLPGQTSQANQQRADRSKKKVLRMLLIVVILFALCWLPVHVLSFLWFFSACKTVPISLQWSAYFLAHANSAINPCVYVIFNENFRQGFLRAVTCACGRTGTRVSPRRSTIGMDNTYIDGATRSSNPTSPSPRMIKDTYT